jgi:hypothetical protein
VAKHKQQRYQFNHIKTIKHNINQNLQKMAADMAYGELQLAVNPP